ncbi:hypothetical protein BCR44DRAFT_65355 [Catenaria anguillulae PL171]|uniref:Adenine DNA glycosylase n=1 Tax=Catenaria anguillulae PL171 TaxID=765915 RepID=A0A1Y2I1B1_9FUNG|nr:hypothetical protein BCR44DRAFT_65355 [Catenaria anguillulae PL171]
MPPRSAPRSSRSGSSSSAKPASAKAKSNPTIRAKSNAKKAATSRSASSSTTIEDMEDLVHGFAADEIPLIRSGLIAWFDANKRDLPWRRTRCTDGTTAPAASLATAADDGMGMDGADAEGSSAPVNDSKPAIQTDADRQVQTNAEPSSSSSPLTSPVSRKRPARAAAQRGSIKRAKLSEAVFDFGDSTAGESDEESASSSSDLSDMLSDSSADEDEDEADSDSDNDSNGRAPHPHAQPVVPSAPAPNTSPAVTDLTLANASVFPSHVDRNAPGQHAYEVWVSEIMCQQTQVATATPYYITWMSKWPTVFDLARASQEEVTQAWSGLGYYSRAHRLLTSSQLLVSSHAGILPSDPIALASQIPGIGKYTAGAIASIAYGIATPVVDGNVIRVLSRMRALGGDPKTKSMTDLHWTLAGQLVHGCDRPGDWNEALMELGATVCTPTSPACGQCPVRESCWAQKGLAAGCTCAHCQTWKEVEGGEAANPGDVTIYPRKPVKKAPRDETVYVAVVHHVTRAKYCIVQRPAQGLLANMWEYVCDADKDVVEVLVQTLVAAEVGGEIKRRKKVGSVTHLFSHIKMTLEVEYVSVTGSAAGENEDEEGTLASALGKRAVKWVTEEEMQVEAVSTGMKKVFKLVKEKVKGLSEAGEGENHVEDDDVMDQSEPKNKAAKGKGKTAKVDPKQPSIASFFKKK